MLEGATRLSLACAMLAGSVMPALASDWSQAYIGIGLGADVVYADGEIEAGKHTTTLSHLPIGGGIGGTVVAGYDHQLSPWWVAGGLLEYDWASVGSSAKAEAMGLSGEVDLAQVGSALTLAGRAGYLLMPDTLAYGLVGYSWLHGKGDLGTGDLGGVVYGGGIEHKITPRFSVRGEYRYTQLDDIHAEVPLLGASLSASPSLQTARLVAAYRLGSGREMPEHGSDVPRDLGWYVGYATGLDAVTRDLKLEGNTHIGGVSVGGFTFPGIDIPFSGELNGFGGGDFSSSLLAGYDFRLAGPWVAGVTASYEHSWDHGSRITLSSAGTKLSADLVSLSSTWMIGARAGYEIQPDSLVYGLAGYTQAELDPLDYSLTGAALPGGGISGSLDLPTFSGYVLGIGFTKQIWDRFSMGVEYRYTDLTGQTIAEGKVGPASGHVDLDPDIHSVMLNTTYSLGGGF